MKQAAQIVLQCYRRVSEQQSKSSTVTMQLSRLYTRTESCYQISLGGNVDRLQVTSIVDGTNKLLGVPKLISSFRQAAADSVFKQLQLWKCYTLVVGMCFDSTEESMELARFWKVPLATACYEWPAAITCSRYSSQTHSACLGPEVILFKMFRDNWFKLNYEVKKQGIPKILV